MTTNVINKYPNDIGNNFYHAEALVENGKDEEAISFLMRALAMQPDEEYLLEERSFHIQAKKMLERLKN
jgi:hypothetical protein